MIVPQSHKVQCGGGYGRGGAIRCLPLVSYSAPVHTVLDRPPGLGFATRHRCSPKCSKAFPHTTLILCLSSRFFNFPQPSTRQGYHWECPPHSSPSGPASPLCARGSAPSSVLRSCHCQLWMSVAPVALLSEWNCPEHKKCLARHPLRGEAAAASPRGPQI